MVVSRQFIFSFSDLYGILCGSAANPALCRWFLFLQHSYERFFFSRSMVAYGAGYKEIVHSQESRLFIQVLTCPFLVFGKVWQNII